MSVMDDSIHSSELETGLSFRDESWAQEVTLSSRSFKVHEIVCSFKQKDVAWIRDKF